VNSSHNPASLCERLIALTLEHAADDDTGIGCPRLRGKDCTTRACHKRGGWATGPITLENATCFDMELQTQLKEAVAFIDTMAKRLTRKCAWVCTDWDYWQTECLHSYVINSGGPSDNNMQFCTYCGGHIEVRDAAP
jgi:hypothetical protein